MNLHLFSRIFSSNDTKNIIIYSSDWLINNDKQILESFGFKKKYSSKREGNNCLNISDLNQFFWITEY